MQSTNILGISAYYHDSAACLVRDGQIVAAAQEERFTRKKQDAGFPARAIRYCLDEAGISMSHLRYIVFYDKPLVKFERLLETYLAFAPSGLQSFLAAMPVWMKEKMLLKSLLQKELVAISEGLGKPRTTDLRPWLWGTALRGTSEHSPRSENLRSLVFVLPLRVSDRGSSPHSRTGRSVVRGK